MLAQAKGTQDRWKIRQSKGANQVLFIHFENHLFIHGFGHLHALSQIHPPSLDSNPSKSFWVNGGDVATYKCPRIDLDQKSFLRSKVQLFIYNSTWHFSYQWTYTRRKPSGGLIS